MTWTACIVCGEPSPASRCDEHAIKPKPRSKTTTQRGYDSRWRRLSERARRLQPWCSDCNTTEDLTTDHLRWPARTLDDVDVVCRSCNSRRGPIRGVNARRDLDDDLDRNRESQNYHDHHDYHEGLT